MVYSDTWPEHLKHIQVSFDRLVWANLPGNLAKPEFAKATLTYLYMVVGQGQVPRVRARPEVIDKFLLTIAKISRSGNGFD